jgi:hypothetical protein
MWQACHVTAGSPQRDGAEQFTAPAQVNHRRYEALRAFFVDGLSYAQAGARFGYTRWAMVSLVREFRAGKLELFAPPRRPGPPPGTAPARDRARGRVIELRRQGLSTYEISARLAAEGKPLNRTSVGQILAALRARLPGYHAATPDVIQRRFLETPGQIITTSDQITVRLERRAYSPGLRKAGLPATTTVPWWGNRTIRYELT